MSAENFRGNENEQRQLFPVSKNAVDRAFPPGERITRDMLVEETKRIQKENKDLFSHLSYDSLIAKYKGTITVNFATFRDSAIFTRRILRHQDGELPVLSQDMLDTYTIENRRGIANHPWSMKEYFAEKWASEFKHKEEHAELAQGVDRIGQLWSGNTMDAWAGAYYIARAYQREEEVRDLHKQFPTMWNGK
jgi:hypothetical protein